MGEFRKTNLTIDASYRDGSALLTAHKTPAKVRLQDIPEVPTFQELNLRIVVDSKDAEELLEGIINGELYLAIEEIPTLVERNSK